jgi:aminoglycoside phosphotransferase (APT) family kinase protein
MISWQARLQAWSGCAILDPLAGGYRNAAMLVRRGDMQLVAKTTRRNEAQLTWLLAVHSAARAAGFVVPEYILSDNGNMTEDGVTLETFIPGYHPQTLADARLAEQLARFHALGRKLPQRPGFASAAELLHTTQGGDIDLSRMPGALVDCCRSAWAHLQHHPTTAIHGDLNPDNLIITPAEQLALIDWDEARVDSPIFDSLLQPTSNPLDARAQLAFEIASSWQREPEYAQTLIAQLGCEAL